MKRTLALLFLLAAIPAQAQHLEVSGLGGYTTGSDIDKKTLGIQELKLKGSFTFGADIAYLFNPHVGVDVLWAHQQTAIRIGTSAGSADLFSMTAAQLHANVVYQPAGETGKLRPFLLAGLGVTNLSAQDMQGEMKFSWGVGAGLKWFPKAGLGARVHARYNPTRLNDAGGDYCDPFGFCQDKLSQFELLGGFIIRF